MCVTSPPYWRLRKYSDDPREIGQEATIAEYVAALVAVFDEVWRVLADDGTLWVNLGDSYVSTPPGNVRGVSERSGLNGVHSDRYRETLMRGHATKGDTSKCGLPLKSLIGLPWRVAFALQDRGWVLRSEIIWEKPNGMPESVQDRPTLAHEHLFLFAKQGEYFCDMKAIAEPAKEHHSSAASFKRNGNKRGVALVPGNTATHRPDRPDVLYSGGTRNARTIWRINTNGIPDEHYAPFPDELPRRCILAGSRPGDAVLDPFAGSGTTCRVAESLGRHSIGIDLGYQALQERRTDNLQIDMRAFL